MTQVYADMHEFPRQIEAERQNKRSVIRTYTSIFKHYKGVGPNYRQREARTGSNLWPYMHIMEALLEQDKSIPRMQRYPATRIYDLLRKEHSDDKECTMEWIQRRLRHGRR